MGAVKDDVYLTIYFISTHELRNKTHLKWSQKKLQTMLMQNYGWTNKEYFGIFDIG